MHWVQGGGSLLLGGSTGGWAGQPLGESVVTGFQGNQLLVLFGFLFTNCQLPPRFLFTNCQLLTGLPGNKLLAQFGFLLTTTMTDATKWAVATPPNMAMTYAPPYPPAPPYLGPFTGGTGGGGGAGGSGPGGGGTGGSSGSSSGGGGLEQQPAVNQSASGGHPAPPPPPSPAPTPAQLQLEQAQADWLELMGGNVSVSLGLYFTPFLASPVNVYGYGLPVLRDAGGGTVYVAATRYGDGRVIQVRQSLGPGLR